MIVALIVLVYFIRKTFNAKKREKSMKNRKTVKSDADATAKHGSPPRITNVAIPTSVVMVDMENDDGRETSWAPAAVDTLEKTDKIPPNFTSQNPDSKRIFLRPR